jgi:hypothetical protein
VKAFCEGRNKKGRKPFFKRMKRKHSNGVEGEEEPEKKKQKVVDQRFLDNERKEAVCQKRTSKEGPLPKTYTEEDKKRLIETFVWTLVKATRTHGEPARQPKKKTWRKERPPPEKEASWRHVQQNTPAWMEIREQSSGASSLLRSMGWDAYRTTLDFFREDAGLVAEPEKSIDDMFACDLGHRDEHLSQQLTSILIGADLEETGVWIHPVYPYAHASPDSLITYPDIPYVLNKYIWNDSLRGLWENKCSIFWALLNKLGKKHWKFPHAIRPYHVIQMQGQAACVSPETEWTEYTSFWKFSEKCPLKKMEGKQGEGCVKFGEMLISRCYATKECANEIYAYLRKHKNAVENQKQPEKSLYHIDSKTAVKWVPLVHCIWYMNGHPLDFAFGSDPSTILVHETKLGPAAPVLKRPEGWIGEYPPQKCLDITSYYDQEPLKMTLHEFADMI